MFHHEFTGLLERFALHLVNVHATGKIVYWKIKNGAAMIMVDIFAVNLFAQKIKHLNLVLAWRKIIQLQV